jgi:hypothetical protein
MIDLKTEELVSLRELAKLVPPGRNGRRTHLSSVLRWILTGAKAPSGEAVCLEGLRIGGRWFSSREALARFGGALTPQAEGSPPPAPRSPTQRRRASERAERELAKIGI